MKTLVGVDLAGDYKPALKLAQNLRFQDQEFLLVHALEPMPPYAPPMEGAAVDPTLWLGHLRQCGRESLEEATQTIEAARGSAKALLIEGPPAESLMAAAADQHVDLVIAGSQARSGTAAFVFGSVARALCIGAPQSILITKGVSECAPPLTAVFATDHSDYADRCLQKLLAWRPRGIEKIHIVTALEMTPDQRNYMKVTQPQLADDYRSLCERHIRLQSHHVAELLEKAGYETNILVIEGDADLVLKESMRAFKADLLIMGAQGHGFFERLMVGSTALQQVVSENYPVLVLRA